jgi:hypothetical protein
MKLICEIAGCCAPGAPPLEEGAAEVLAQRFKALADPARVAIVNRLAGAERSASAPSSTIWAFLSRPSRTISGS